MHKTKAQLETSEVLSTIDSSSKKFTTSKPKLTIDDVPFITLLIGLSMVIGAGAILFVTAVIPAIGIVGSLFGLGILMMFISAMCIS